MKKMALHLFALLIIAFTFQANNQSLWAQNPQKMSYQAVIRNSSNQLVSNQIIGMRISILQGSEAGTTVYTETQTINTNTNGLVSIEIGGGSGFDVIDWANGPYFIKTETDPSGGTNYTITGVSQLLSVPYALYAKKAENGLTLPYSKSTNDANQAFTITNTLGNAIRGISNGSGTGVFGENTSNIGSTTGVYGKTVSATGFGVHGSSPFVGVRGWSDTIAGLSYGVLGFAESPSGYAVYGRNMAQSGSSIGVFGKSDSPDGYGVYGSSPDIAVKGNSTGTSGTGVSGIGSRIGVSGTATATTGPGAYAINGETQSPIGYGVYGGSYSNTGTTYGVYGTVNSPDGYGVYGNNGSITGTTYGIYGTAASPNGYGVYGNASKIGVKGVSTGVTGTGVSGTGIHIGVSGSATGTSGSVFAVIGETQSTVGYGVYGGSYSNTGTTYGIFGTVISPDGFSGYFEGGKFYTNSKVGIGTTTPGAALHIKGTGFPNSFIYLEAAAANDAGFRLYEGTTAKWHIFNSTGAGGLQIYNTAASTAIFCKQSNSFVGINTTTPNYNLEVNGTAGKTGGGSWSTSSDIRLKDVTGNYDKGLTEIAALQPVLFTYKNKNPRNLPANSEQIGFVAQDVQKIFPEAVTKAEDGYLDFNIHAINVALVNAVKELKTQNDLLKTQNEQIDARLKTLEKIISASAMK